ncbi:MAG: DUF4238 domain-containing protein [Terriglobia bacterium]|nr:DUF4238 domain-containing protein [Terriglobia bacterium]
MKRGRRILTLMGITLQTGADHHYVPRFYLNGFTDKKGVLWAYEKGAAAPRASKPKEEGSREDYYVFTELGEKDDSTEQMLGTLENIVAPIFHHLRRREHKLSPQEVGHLFAFMGVMFVRVPAYREYRDIMTGMEVTLYAQEMMKTPGVFEKFVRYYEAKTGKPLADPEKVRQAVISGEFVYKQQSKVMNLAFIFRDAQEIGKALIREYGYDLYFAPSGSYYVTSDNPIVTIGPDGDGKTMVGLGFSWPHTQVIFPINKRVCAILSRDGRERKIDATPQKFGEINRLLMFTAQKYLYAAENSVGLGQEFEQQGCRLKYGENALIPFDFKA